MWGCGDAGEERPIGVGLQAPCSAPLVNVDEKCWEKIPTSGSCDPAQPVAVRELGACLPSCTTDSTCKGGKCVDFGTAGKACVVPACDDNEQNRGEAGVDCGGPCGPCGSCGDGEVQEALGETCDHDGSPQTQCGYGEESCEVCTDRCVKAPGQVTGFCGDGTPQAANGEQCDEAPKTDCDYGRMSCMVCNDQCQRVPGQVSGFCGDGEVQAAEGETCDHDGSPQTQCEYGPRGDCMFCNDRCQLVAGVARFCGDEAVNGQEECDAGLNPGLDCMYGMTSCMVCNDQCKRVSGETFFCGNNKIDDNETCDHNKSPQTDCAYGQMSCTVCNAQCQTVAGVLSFCGDNMLNGAERCDTSKFAAGESCTAAGSPYGALSCSPSCQVQTTGCYGVKQLATGYRHSCVVLTDNRVMCWGSNGFGQLGNNTTTASSTPALAIGLNNAAQIATGLDHTCALTTAGTVICWGQNVNGELGLGHNNDRLTPTMIPNLSGVTQIKAKGAFTCALLSSGTVKCWGANTNNAALGDGTTTNRNVPTNVLNISGATQLAVGSAHACVLVQGGAVRCWGANDYGQAGDGSMTHPKAQAVQVTGISGALELDAGLFHSCVRLAAGEVKCWGLGAHGQRGDGSTTANMFAPVAATQLAGATQLYLGGEHTCIKVASGAVRCLGSNEHGQLGDSSLVIGASARSTSLRNVSNLSNASEARGGRSHTCALLSDKTLRCWGRNDAGQLGDGTTTDRSAATQTLF
jgi:alpha-tubulin suppressor-like RCC1 family protein